MDLDAGRSLLELLPLILFALLSFFGSRKRRRKKASSSQPYRPSPQSYRATPDMKAPGELTAEDLLESLKSLDPHSTDVPSGERKVDGATGAMSEPGRVPPRSPTQPGYPAQPSYAAQPGGSGRHEGIELGRLVVSDDSVVKRRARAHALPPCAIYWRQRLKALKEPRKAREAIVLAELVGKPKAFQHPFS